MTASVLFSNAELALAAYAVLQPGITRNQIAALGGNGDGMSVTQAQEFALRYPEIITQVGDDASGFSMTAFRDASGAIALAVRGTDEVFSDWFATNTNIAINGAGYQQIISLYNAWQRLTHRLGETITVYRTNLGNLTNPVIAETIVNDLGSVATPLISSGAAVDVAGHSTGGHLALAFAGLFPSNTRQVYAFNAPGFKDSTLNINFFVRLGGELPTGTSPRGVSVINVIADAMPGPGESVSPIAGLHSRPGTPLDIAIENQAPLTDEPNPDRGPLNHSQMILTNSLAVFALLARFAPALSAASFESLLSSAALGTAGGLERIVDALGRTLGMATPTLQTGNNEREALYQAIYAAQANATYRALEGVTTLRILADTDTNAATLTSQATADFGKFLALTHLSPFAIEDAPSPLVDAHPDLYARWSVDRTKRDAGATDLEFTDRYLADRAAFLVAKNAANAIDSPSVVVASQSDNWRYVDLPSKYEVTAFGSAPVSIRRWGVFGSDGADLVRGDKNADHLYGGLGTDLLAGEAGNDYVEGGRGRDVYQYSGYRSLLGNLTNDGADEIRDTDGSGYVRYQFVQKTLFSSTTQSAVAGGVGLKVSETEWISPDGKFTYAQQFAGLNVTINGDAGGSIRILDFDYAKAQSEGYLGIRLINAPVGPETARTIAGDFAPFDSDPGQTGVQTVLDELGNVQLTSNPEPGRVDLLKDSAASDLIVSGGGDDLITGFRGGNDWIKLGAGRDDASSTSGGRDYVEAGGNTSSGGDIVFTGDGDDTVFADMAPADFNAAFATLLDPNAASSGIKGDFISTGAGDDIAFGASDNDVLAGGGGADILLGGSGNDYLLGDSRYQAQTLDWTVTRQFTGNYPVADFASFTGVPAITDDPAAGNDALYAGAGDDWLSGGGANDYLEAGAGNDFAFGDVGDDVVVGGAGNDVLDGDVATLAAASGGNDFVDGGAGNDVLYGRGGDDLLFAGDGDDTIDAGSGNDVIVGGTGNDVIKAGTGKDTYVYSRGDGVDRIEDPDTGVDALVLALGEGVAREDVKFRTGSLLIDLGQGDAIHIEGFDAANPQGSAVLERIEFSDGSSMTWGDVLLQGFDLPGSNSAEFILGTGVNDRIDALGGDDVVNSLAGDDVVNAGTGNDFVFAGSGNDTVLGEAGNDFLSLETGDDLGQGGDGADQIFGGIGNDTLEGGAGDDTLSGEEGADRYVLARGAGRDTISEQGADSTLEFRTTSAEGLDASEFTVTARHDSSGAAELTLDYGATAGVDQVRVSKGLTTIAAVVFTNTDTEESEMLTVEELIDQASKPSVDLTGGDGNDELDGGFAADTLAGGAGDDTLYAWWGDDVLSGGVGRDRLLGDRGDDRLFGEAGNDTLEGDAGNDLLAGGIGANVLRGGAGGDEYVLEDGATQLIEENGTAGIETIRLAAGRSMDDLGVYRVGNDLALKGFSGAAAAYVENFFVETLGKEWVLAGDLEAPRDLAAFVAERLGGAGNEAAALAAFKVSLEADLVSRGARGEALGELVDLRYAGVPNNPFLDYSFSGVSASSISVSEAVTLLPSSEAETRETREEQFTRTESFPTYSTVLTPGNTWIVTVPQGATGPSYPQGSTVTTLGGGQFRIEEPGSYRSVQNGVQTIERTYSAFTTSIERGFTVHAVTGTAQADTITAVEPLPDDNFYYRAFRGTVDAGAGNDFVDLGDRVSEDMSDNVENDGGFGLGLGALVNGGAGNDTLYGTAADDVLYGGEGSDFLDGGRGADTYYALFQGEDTDVIYDLPTPGGPFFGYGYGGIYPRDTLVFEPGITPGSLSYTLTEDSAYDGRRLLEISNGGASKLRVVFSDPTSEDGGESTTGIERFRFADGLELTREQFLEQVAQGGGNEAPVVNSPIADEAALEDAPFALQLPADTFIDPDGGDTLTLSAMLEDGGALPAWLSFDAETQTFSGTPAQGDVGPIDVLVTATDAAGESASDAFTLEVANVNDAPTVVQALAVQSFEAGVAFTFALPAGSFADEDVGDALALTAGSFETSGLPAWLAFDAATATFSGNPGIADIGISHLEVTATDTVGAQVGSDFGLIVRAAAGSSVTGGAGDDVIYGGTGDETLIARGGSDYLNGDAGNDLLRGGGGNDALQGGEGADVLRGGTGQNLLDGGAGDDLIYGGQGAGLIAGGAGNDVLRVGRGNDVIVFNAGDGMDSVYGGRDGGNTLSFGGGIGYSDLSLERSGRDLVVHAGENDKVTLKNWYSGNHSVLNLQLILDATEEFDATSSDPLHNRRVQGFDFLGMVGAFDQARAANPGVTSWALTNAMLQFHLSAADDAALGGDLAYWYGRNRSFAGISLAAAQANLGAPGFGADAQTLHPFAGLQEGFVKLA